MEGPSDEVNRPVADHSVEFGISIVRRVSSCANPRSIPVYVLDQKRIKNRAIFKILGAGTMHKMVECGNGIGLQGKSLLAGEANRFYEYPVEPLIKTDLILIANSFENLSPAAKAFIDTIRGLKSAAMNIQRLEEIIRFPCSTFRRKDAHGRTVRYLCPGSAVLPVHVRAALVPVVPAPRQFLCSSQY